MNRKLLYHIINYCVAAIWLVNGLFCKVLHLVPGHQQIVGRILGTAHATALTTLIGLSEMVMAIWIISKIKTKLNAVVQMVIITTMNAIEFLLVPDLLLWGRFNAVFALVLIIIIYYNTFVLHKKLGLIV
jgi:uncharacterized membrane protein YphA (DoxX/SURF4 family)